MFRSFSFRSKTAPLVAAAVALTAGGSSLFAGTTTDYAGQVIAYSQGTGANATYNDPTAALGAPEPLTGVGTSYVGIVDPFNPAYDTNQIVVLGDNGSITLQLQQPFTVSKGPQLGILSNVGLAETSAGNVGSPAELFGGGVADVRVSSDDKTWVDLGNVTFNLPSTSWSKFSNEFESAPAPGDVASNPGLPFTGNVSNFNGESVQQVLATLNGSVGGTWLNVSGTNLKTVDYVQIRNPLGNPWVPGNPVQLTIDGITVSSASFGGGGNPGGPGGGGTGSAVPLPPATPAALVFAAGAGLWMTLRRKFSRA